MQKGRRVVVCVAWAVVYPSFWKKDGDWKDGSPQGGLRDVEEAERCGGIVGIIADASD